MRKSLPRLSLLALLVLASCSDRAPFAPEAPPQSELTEALTDPALAASAQAAGYIPGRVLARFRTGAPVASLVAGQGAAVQGVLISGTRVLSVPVGREQVVAAALANNPGVVFAEVDVFYEVDVPCGTGTCLTPTDPSLGYRWDLLNDGSITDESGVDLAPTGSVDADMDWVEAFSAMGGITGSSVIGIIDTGIRATHEELAGKVVAGYDFFAGDPDPADDNGHGTHVAAMAAGRGDNGTGVPGVAWMPEVQVASAKVCGLLFGFLYGCPSSAIADGILWATDNGADVLNISLGGAEASTEVQSALQYARQNDVLPMCAAGNDAGAVGYPAAFPECVAVSSTDWGDELASYSNFGPQVQLAAPGGDFEHPSGYSQILSAYNNGDGGYAWLAGTSMASPQVAGLAGLLHALGVTDDDAKLTRMQSTAKDLGTPGLDDQFGAGRINVYQAVADLIGAPTNQAPTASFTANCTDLTCDFTDTSTDDVGSVVGWTWDFGDGNTSIEQNPTHSYALAGTYTVLLTATDDEGESGSVSHDFTVPIPNQDPTASFTWSCSGFSCDFSDTSVDGDGSVVGWTWDFGDGNASTEQNPSHVYAAVGSYTVTLTATDDDGANDVVSQQVSVAEPNQPPVAGLTYACTGLSCDFTDTSTDSDGTVSTYQWSFGDGWSSSGENPSHVYQAPGTYTVAHWVYDDGGASDTTSTQVTVFEADEAPTASFTVSCTDLTCDFTDTSTDDQGSVVGWAWDFGDGNTSTEQHPNHTYATAGTYTVLLTATDDVGASDDFSRDVTVPSGNQAPTASFTWSCTDLTCDFTDASADGDGTVVGWAWDFGDGNTSTEPSPSHTYSVAGPYTVTLTVTDDGGAADTASQGVSVAEPNQPPVAGFTYECTDLTCSFTNTSTDSDGTVTIHGWAFGDGWTSSGDNPSHTYQSPGTYTVTHWIFDDGGASDTTNAPVAVFAAGEPPTASFTVVCTDLSCDFTDTSTDDQGSVVGWAWDFGDGNTSTEQHPSHTYASAGTYAVSLTATDDVGASDEFSRQVIVPSGNQPPTASFTSTCTDLTCEFNSTSLDADGSIVAWAWDFGDGNTSTEESPSHTYGAAGPYTVTLTVTDDDGASDGASQGVSVAEPNQPPVAGFVYQCTGLSCDFTNSSTDSDGTITAYQWAFGDGWTSSGENPSHLYQNAGTYTVAHWVYDDGGASDTTTQTITVGEAPVASFTVSCTDLTCDFTDTSTDGDGSVVFWSWDFGDGGTSFAQSPSHSYAAAGSYSVTVTVQDDDGVEDVATQVVTVSAPAAQIALSAVGYKVRGRQKVDLTWSGATSADVDVHRDGVIVFTTVNDGSETDPIDLRGSGSYVYQVCEAGTSTCSEEVTVTF